MCLTFTLDKRTYENMNENVMLLCFGKVFFLINNMAKFHKLSIEFKIEIGKYETQKYC